MGYSLRNVCLLLPDMGCSILFPPVFRLPNPLEVGPLGVHLASAPLATGRCRRARSRLVASTFLPGRVGRPWSIFPVHPVLYPILHCDWNQRLVVVGPFPIPSPYRCIAAAILLGRKVVLVLTCHPFSDDNSGDCLADVVVVAVLAVVVVVVVGMLLWLRTGGTDLVWLVR